VGRNPAAEKLMQFQKDASTNGLLLLRLYVVDYIKKGLGEVVD
jgi:hypothetical protein